MSDARPAGWGPGWGRARRVQWRVAVAATTLNGLVVGYGAVWFQLFGDRADRADYLTSAGGYLGAALVLALAPLTLLSPPQRRWGGSVGSWWAGAAALLLAVLGLSSLGTGMGMDEPTGPFGGLDDGLGAVMLWPWCWLLLWAAARGIYDRVRAR
jgi:hypothetical protein